MWNWMAGILSFAMVIVGATLARIIVTEHKRHALYRRNHQMLSPELWLFAMTGIIAVIMLWSIMAVQWWNL